MNPDLKNLYQATLLRHSKQPCNAGPLPHAHAARTLRNPLCGDEVTVFLQLDSSRVSKIQFVGQCCSICTAAASMMTERLAGATTAEAAAFAQTFVSSFQSRAAPTDVLEGDLASLAAVLAFPSRIRCATLPFEALASAIDSLP